MPQAINLRDLIERSNSTRQYFLSLPVDTQMKLHAMNDHIRTADALRRHVDFLERTGFLH